MGCEIVVVNPSSDDKKELIDDFIAVITSFCARIYGLRRGQRKKFKLKEVIRDESDN
jgi:predicted site-specific integrase-resolvase